MCPVQSSIFGDFREDLKIRPERSAIFKKVRIFQPADLVKA